MRIGTKKSILFLVGITLLATTGVALISTNFEIVNYLFSSNGGGTMSSSSKAVFCSIGQGLTGNSESANYKTEAGYVAQIVSAVATASATLDRVYVYPNPYKPGSGGNYDANYITFTNLTQQATIEIFNIAGELVRKIEKDSDQRNFQWVPENEAGKSLASGVYIFYISNDGGQKKTGRFAIVK